MDDNTPEQTQPTAPVDAAVDTQPTGDESAVSAQAEPTPAPTPEPTPEPTPAPTAAPAAEAAAEPAAPDFASMTSAEVHAQVIAGTLDLGSRQSVLCADGYYCNPNA